MRRIVLATCAVTLAAGVLPAQGVTAPAPEAGLEAGLGEQAHHEDQFFDVRFEAPVAPVLDAVRAAARLRAGVPALHVTWNTRFGTAKHVFSDTGFLTPPARVSPGDAGAERIARAWLGRHRELFGLSARAVQTLATTRNAALPAGGAHALVFRTSYGGFTTFSGGTLGVNLARDGRIVSVWADTGFGDRMNATRPRLSGMQAVEAFARFAGADDFDAVVRAQARARPDRLTIFEPGSLYAPHNARLVAFPMPGGPRLGWRVFLGKDPEEMLTGAVDALTGKVLLSYNGVQHAEGTVYENHPGAPLGGTPKVVSFDGDPVASPLGWVGLPLSADQKGPEITTIGNNAFAGTDWGQYKLAPPGAVAVAGAQANPVHEYAPVAPDGKFNYTFTNNWGAACTPFVTPSGIDAPAPVGRQAAPAGRTIENPSYTQDRDPSVVNIFYLVNKIHDLAYRYGFNEKFGNFQWENFGRGGRGKDPVRYQSMAGILNNRLNNANMFTPPDGGEPADMIHADDPQGSVDTITAFVPPRGNMYLWRPGAGSSIRCSDGDQDASIAYHEYTHGISNRMVGGPDDAGALGAPQSGAMGEAWSDWVALNFLHIQGVEDRGLVGPYATGNEVRGIRNYAMNRNPMTYGDFGWSLTGPQVHSDGELWAATLWDLRTALVAKYGERKGADIATFMVFDSFAKGPRLPSYLDMRDAMIASNRTRYKAKDLALIWSVFAERGMGRSAKSDDAKDVTPTPAFDVPGANNGVLSVKISDVDGGVLPGVRIVAGGLAQGAAHGAAVTNRSGVARLPMQPGTYVLRAGAPGYGLQKLGSVTVEKGETVSRQFSISKNLASIGWGGVVTSGLPEGSADLALLDDRDATGLVGTKETPIVVRLGGTGPATLRSVVVAPRGAGVGARAPVEFTVDTSKDGRAWRRLGRVSRRFTFAPASVELSPAAIPGKGVKARFVRIVVTKTLTDLFSPPTARPSAARKSLGLNEVMVYGSAPGAKVALRGIDPVFTEDGNVQIASQSASTASTALLAWQNTCAKPPAPIQGLDGFVVELPDSAGDGLHFFNLDNKGGEATDLDAFFYARNCTTLLGGAATAAASEAAALPVGTKWVYVVLYSGTTTGFTVRTRTTLQRVTAPIG